MSFSVQSQFEKEQFSSRIISRLITSASLFGIRTILSHTARCPLMREALRKGKTNLAVAAAYRAIQKNLNALFLTAPSSPTSSPGSPAGEGELPKQLPHYTYPGVLVVDEVG